MYEPIKYKKAKFWISFCHTLRAMCRDITHVQEHFCCSSSLPDVVAVVGKRQVKTGLIKTLPKPCLQMTFSAVQAVAS